jgi:DNA-binding transcriptional ArsR family regulator
MPSRRQVLLASAALLGSPCPAVAATSANILQLRVEYTATSLIGTDEGTTPGRLWRTRWAVRHEGKQHGRALTVIARLDRNLVWLVMAEPRFAIETDLSALDLPLDALNGGGGVREIREGRERVNELDTLRIRVERNTGSGSRFAGHVWATDQGVIARLAGDGETRGRRGRTLMNFRDVQIGLLDPGLFEAPRGVRIVQVKGGDLATLLEGMDAAGQIGLGR